MDAHKARQAGRTHAHGEDSAEALVGELLAAPTPERRSPAACRSPRAISAKAPGKRSSGGVLMRSLVPATAPAMTLRAFDGGGGRAGNEPVGEDLFLFFVVDVRLVVGEHVRAEQRAFGDGRECAVVSPGSATTTVPGFFPHDRAAAPAAQRSSPSVPSPRPTRTTRRAAVGPPGSTVTEPTFPLASRAAAVSVSAARVCSSSCGCAATAPSALTPRIKASQERVEMASEVAARVVMGPSLDL